MTAKRLVERPTVCQIGPDIWRIFWRTEEEWQTGHYDDTADGLTFGTETTINMRMRVSSVMEQHYQTVLLHELHHAIWASTYITGSDWLTEFSKVDDLEEAIIGMITPHLIAMLRMNEHVTQYLMSDSTAVREPVSLP